MARKIKMTEPKVITEDTPASDSIMSKTGVIASVNQAVAGMSQDQVDVFHNYIVDFFNKSMGQAAEVAGSIAPDQSLKNQASIAAKTAMREDVAALFGDEQLTEEFKEKATVLFEAAVSARVSEQVAVLQEESEALVESEVTSKVEELIDATDKYISYVAEEWLTENQVAVVESLEYEILKELHESVVGAYKLHNISIPESKIDIVEELMNKVDSLENQLNEQTNRFLEVSEKESQFAMEEVFETAAQDLNTLETERFRTLAESVDFDGDLQVFSKKLGIIRNQFFSGNPGKKTYTTDILTEDFDGDPDQSEGYMDPSVKRIVEATSRSIRKN